MTKKLEWTQSRQHTTAPCLICGRNEGNTIILKAAHWHQEGGMMELAHCASCGSAYFLDTDKKLVAYPSADEALGNPDFVFLIHHYLELVGGLDWKVWLLEQLPFESFNSVLEIGCNVGVALDYCMTNWKCDAVGLEPSAYGILGERFLKTPIIPKYTHEAEEIRSRQFDFIYATEVLEHIANPQDFLAELRNYLTEDGVMLITTPNSEYVSPTASPGALYAALSAGAHYFLLSPMALRAMVHKAGFSFCEISEFGMTNVAIISNKPVKKNGYPVVHPRIRDYYRAKQSLATPDPRVHLGHLINYYTNATQSGDFDDEADISGKIEAALGSLFDIHLEHPGDLIEKIIQTDSLFAVGRTIPYSLPSYLYHRAKNRQNAGRSPGELYALAAVLMAQLLKVNFQEFFCYHALFESAIQNAKPFRTDGATKGLLERARQISMTVSELRTSETGFAARGARKIRRMANSFLRVFKPEVSLIND